MPASVATRHSLSPSFKVTVLVALVGLVAGAAGVVLEAYMLAAILELDAAELGVLAALDEFVSAILSPPFVSLFF